MAVSVTVPPVADSVVDDAAKALMWGNEVENIPLTWFAAEMTGYYLASRSCEPGRAGVPLEGTAHPRATHLIVETIAAAVVVAGIAIAVQNWRATAGDARPGGAPARGRAHFMSFAGVVVGALALFGVLLFDASGIVVNACSQAR